MSTLKGKYGHMVDESGLHQPSIDVEEVLIAAETGNASAMSTLGVIFANGQHGQKKNLKKAYKWFEKAGTLGDIHGQINCAKLLLLGEVPDGFDPCVAFQNVRIAAKTGIDLAVFLAGECLQNGCGCPRDEAKAVQFFRAGAATAGHAACMASLGHALIHGKGCDANEEEAFSWLMKAAEQGDLNGLRNAGVMLCGGKGCTRDRARGRALLQQAADAGDDEARLMLLNEELVGGEGGAAAAGAGAGSGGPGPGDLIQALREKAQAGDDRAMSRLAVHLSNGRGCPKDEVEAFKWFKAAAALGNEDSRRNFAICLLAGDGCTADPARGRRVLRGCAEDGDAHAMWRLGIALQQGEGGDVNLESSFDWLKRAAAAGSAAGMSSLGHAYVHGKGCPSDMALAFQWMEKAANKEDLNGLRNAGLMLCMGQGCDKDEERGRALLRRAADAGDTEAAKQVALMDALADL